MKNSKKFSRRMNARDHAVTDDVLLQLASRHEGIEDFIGVCCIISDRIVITRRFSDSSNGKLICIMS
jgi:hypothetical protein